jgi:hypothetical protein
MKLIISYIITSMMLNLAFAEGSPKVAEQLAFERSVADYCATFDGKLPSQIVDYEKDRYGVEIRNNIDSLSREKQIAVATWSLITHIREDKAKVKKYKQDMTAVLVSMQSTVDKNQELLKKWSDNIDTKRVTALAYTLTDAILAFKRKVLDEGKP